MIEPFQHHLEFQLPSLPQGEQAGELLALPLPSEHLALPPLSSSGEAGHPPDSALRACSSAFIPFQQEGCIREKALTQRSQQSVLGAVQPGLSMWGPSFVPRAPGKGASSVSVLGMLVCHWCSTRHPRTLLRREAGRGEGPYGYLLLRPATRPNCHEPREAQSDVLLA